MDTHESGASSGASPETQGPTFPGPAVATRDRTQLEQKLLSEIGDYCRSRAGHVDALPGDLSTVTGVVTDIREFAVRIECLNGWRVWVTPPGPALSRLQQTTADLPAIGAVVNGTVRLTAGYVADSDCLEGVGCLLSVPPQGVCIPWHPDENGIISVPISDGEFQLPINWRKQAAFYKEFQARCPKTPVRTAPWVRVKKRSDGRPFVERGTEQGVFVAEKRIARNERLVFSVSVKVDGVTAYDDPLYELLRAMDVRGLQEHEGQPPFGVESVARDTRLFGFGFCGRVLERTDTALVIQAGPSEDAVQRNLESGQTIERKRLLESAAWYLGQLTPGEIRRIIYDYERTGRKVR